MTIIMSPSCLHLHLRPYPRRTASNFYETTLVSGKNDGAGRRRRRRKTEKLLIGLRETAIINLTHGTASGIPRIISGEGAESEREVRGRGDKGRKKEVYCSTQLRSDETV